MSHDEAIKKETGISLEELTAKLQASKQDKFLFLLIGRTGVGKSSTVNSLMGKEVAKVGDFEPTTVAVEVYDSEISGIQFTVVDTPGLCDDLEEAGQDYKYLELIRSRVPRVDLMWFVSRLDETRVTSDEKRGIKLISEAFGEKIWQTSMIVFTFANNVDASRYLISLKKRTELIRNEIAKYTGTSTATAIPSVGVDNTSEFTPDREKWLGELYTQVYERISQKGALPFLMATVSRIAPPPKQVVSEQSQQRYEPSFSSPSFRYETKTEPKQYEPKYESPKYEPPPTPKYEAPKYEAPTYNTKIELKPEQRGRIKERTTKLLEAGLGATAGAAVGATIGSVAGPVGTAVGAAVGAAVGFVGGLFGWWK